MNTLLWIFGISGIVILVMLSYRYYELKSGRNIISDNLRSKTSSKILKFGIVTRDSFRFIVLKINKFSKTLPDRLSLKLHKVWDDFSDKVDMYFHKAKGKRGLDKDSD